MKIELVKCRVTERFFAHLEQKTGLKPLKSVTLDIDKDEPIIFFHSNIDCQDFSFKLAKEKI